MKYKIYYQLSIFGGAKDDTIQDLEYKKLRDKLNGEYIEFKKKYNGYENGRKADFSLDNVRKNEETKNKILELDYVNRAINEVKKLYYWSYTNFVKKMLQKR